MVALTKGAHAPPFSLRGLDGIRYSLQQTLQQSPAVLLAFFKVSCPVCQFELPYLERLHRSYRSIPIWGISQDDADATEAFSRMFGCTFPMLLDESLRSTVDYGLTNVPSVFLINAQLKVARSIVGFNKSELEKLNDDLAQLSTQTAIPLFTAADEVPELKPG